MAVGRLKGLSVVAENGTAKAGSLISGLGTSYVLFLILSIFAILYLLLVLYTWLRLGNIYLMAFFSGQEFGVGLKYFIKKNIVRKGYFRF